MQEIELKQTTELAPLLCQGCGCEMRLIGSEPHSDQDRIDLLTYWCTRCDDYETRDVTSEIVFQQISGRQNGEQVLEAIPKHPVCARCDVPMWLIKVQTTPEKVEYFYECKGCEGKARHTLKSVIRAPDAA
jgi:hypothetical protein